MIERRRAATNYLPPQEMKFETFETVEETGEASESQLDTIKEIWESLSEELDNVLETDDSRFEVVFFLQERINKIFEENA